MPKPNPEDLVVNELRAIKRLLALRAIKQGATQEDLGVALEVDRSVISKMLPGVRPAKRD